MIQGKIYARDWEVDERLVPFGFSRQELIDIGQKTFAERANTIDLDVAGAAGQLGYIHGSRHTRLLATSKGYEVYRQKNIEASRQPSTGIMVVYQNVDLACNEFRSPKAISGKRAGSAEAIECAQGTLFAPDEVPSMIDIESVKTLNSSLWYLCASFTEESFSVELSLPASIARDNFNGFLERIFIVIGQEWLGKPAQTSVDDYIEVEPLVRRKK